MQPIASYAQKAQTTPSDNTTLAALAAIEFVIKKTANGIISFQYVELLQKIKTIYPSQPLPHATRAQEISNLYSEAHRLGIAAPLSINSMVAYMVCDFCEAEYGSRHLGFYAALRYACATINLVNGERNRQLSGGHFINGMAESEKEQLRYWDKIVWLLKHGTEYQQNENATDSLEIFCNEAQELAEEIDKRRIRLRGQ